MILSQRAARFDTTPAKAGASRKCTARAPKARHGQRLDPRKADLQRRREGFAERLRDWGVEAEASGQATRGQVRNYERLGRIKTAEAGRPTKESEPSTSSLESERSRQEAVETWANIARGLAVSHDPADREMAQGVEQYGHSMPFVRTRGLVLDKAQPSPEITVDRGASREVVPAPRSLEPGR
jgi:hypothetical protein